jgi:hypothetical protein
MSLEELHDCNWVARGCVRRSVFVFFSYAFIAATKILRKLEGEAEAEAVWDIVIAPGFQIGWTEDEKETARTSMQKRERRHCLVGVHTKKRIRSGGDD